jgi:hypothetical protein
MNAVKKDGNDPCMKREVWLLTQLSSNGWVLDKGLLSVRSFSRQEITVSTVTTVISLLLCVSLFKCSRQWHYIDMANRPLYVALH